MVEYPYNPNVENNSNIGVEDLMALLASFGMDFEVEELAAQNSTFDGDYNSLTNQPAIPSNVSDLTNDAGYTTFDGAYGNLTGAPTLATVATSGSYTDLSNQLTQKDIVESAYNLTGANLSYANLSYAALSMANLSEADLSGADLQDADLVDAILESVENQPISQLPLYRRKNNFNIRHIDLGHIIQKALYWTKTPNYEPIHIS